MSKRIIIVACILILLSSIPGGSSSVTGDSRTAGLFRCFLLSICRSISKPVRHHCTFPIIARMAPIDRNSPDHRSPPYRHHQDPGLLARHKPAISSSIMVIHHMVPRSSLGLSILETYYMTPNTISRPGDSGMEQSSHRWSAPKILIYLNIYMVTTLPEAAILYHTG